MQLTDVIKERIEKAEHKALATCGGDGPNVVPVSITRLVGDAVWLHNFFMDKTVANIEKDPKAALVFWNGLTGVQLKGEVVYETEGENFESAKRQLAEDYPDRDLRGLLIFTPTSVFDVSANATEAGKQLL